MAENDTPLPAGGARGDNDKTSADAPAEMDHEAHRRRDELLDEGVEETFPASDPVAVKHIT